MNDSQKQRIFEQCIRENQAKITSATLSALVRVDRVSEALTDPEAHGIEAIRQKTDGLVTASHGALDSNSKCTVNLVYYSECS